MLLRVGCAVSGSKGRAGSELSWFGLCSASWPHLGSAGSTWKATHLREGSVFRLTSTWSGARGDPLELGKDRGSRRLDPARPCWSPGPDSSKTTRGGEVRDRFWVSAHLSSELELVIKGLSHHYLGVCVCAYVCPWARLISRKLLSALCAEMFALHFVKSV